MVYEPIKEKGKCLIKITNKKYDTLQEFLQDFFYRDLDSILAKSSYEVMRLIYDRKELGLLAKNWKEHIMNLFGVEPIEAEELEQLKKIIYTGELSWLKLLKISS